MPHAARCIGALAGSPMGRGADGVVYAAIGGCGVLLWWLCRDHAAMLPFWAPWEFSWVEFLAAWLAVWWYLRGLALTAPADRPSMARRVCWFAGIFVIYAVLETRFEYAAEHQFFLNRVQHVAMHHLGPFLIALSWPGAELRRGMPAAVRRLIEHPLAAGMVGVVQQPLPAAVLFVGLILLWLIPPVHFLAMIDARLYAVMNWSMVIDGILFWCLVLDPRPSPPARISFIARGAITLLVMFPQIMVGAVIAFASPHLYSFYDLCGRLFPQWGADYDQALGGLIIWIPPAMMSMLGVVLILHAVRCFEERSFGYDIGDGETPSVSMAATRGRARG